MPSAPTKRGFVYILANRRHGTLYTGVTSNLAARMRTHKGADASGFVRRYGVTRLVYFEEHDRLTDAIRREKQVKAWKIRLIESVNPMWEELFRHGNARPWIPAFTGMTA
ncbi:MAG: GIY-YIG nuclease family protein [Rubricoccaceae bacterium]